MRLCATLLATSMFATFASNQASAEPSASNTLQVDVPNVILIDAGTRTVLFERGADDKVTPASTAKLMTSEYVMSLIKAGKLRRDQSFTISQKAWREGGAPSGGSTMFAKVRSDVPVDDLLHGLIIDYKIYGQRDFLWNKIKQPNRNPLLAMDIGADGLKTGNIDESGYSIVASAVQNGQRLIVALYGAKSSAARSEETRKILQWGFRTFEHRKVFSAGETVGTAQVYGGAIRHVALTTPADVSVLVPRDGSEKLTAKIAYTGPLLAPVEADQPV